MKLCLKACLISPSKDSESSIDFANSSLDFNLQDIQQIICQCFFSFIPFVLFLYTEERKKCDTQRGNKGRKTKEIIKEI